MPSSNSSGPIACSAIAAWSWGPCQMIQITLTLRIRTDQAGRNQYIFSARSFNRGLRAIYFSLAATAWLLGPLGAVCAVQPCSHA